MIRRSQAPFITKAIMARSRLRSKHNNWQSRENFSAFTKAKNYFNNLSEITKKVYFKQMTRRGFVRGKSFWNTVKPFLTKFFFTCESITTENKGKPISDN